MECIGYGTPSLRGIPLASRYRKASHCRGMVNIPRRPTLLLILKIIKSSDMHYHRSHVLATAFGMHCAILMCYLIHIGDIFSACVCNGRRGRLLFERTGRDSIYTECAV